MDAPPSPAVAAAVRYQASRVSTTPQFTAVLDVLFDVVPKRTPVTFSGLALVAGRLVFARVTGESRYRVFVGTRERLASDVLGFARHIDLGPECDAYVAERLATIC